MPRTPLRVAIVSRHEVVARGLAAMLADYPDRVVPTALPSVRGSVSGIDAVLYDAQGLDRSDGDDLEHLIKATTAAVILCSRVLRPDLRARGLAKGCTACVPLSLPSPSLVTAIELAVAGRPSSHLDDSAGNGVGLTDREAETLACIARGLSNEECAAELGVSLNTLKCYIRQAYRKIGATTRAQAVSWAIQHGFPPADPSVMRGA